MIIIDVPDVIFGRRFFKCGESAVSYTSERPAFMKTNKGTVEGSLVAPTEINQL